MARLIVWPLDGLLRRRRRWLPLLQLGRGILKSRGSARLPRLRADWRRRLVLLLLLLLLLLRLRRRLLLLLHLRLVLDRWL